VDKKVRTFQRQAVVANTLSGWQQYAHVLEQALGVGSLSPGKTEFSDHFNKLLKQAIKDQCEKIMEKSQTKHYLGLLRQKFKSLGFDDSFDGIKFDYKDTSYHIIYDEGEANILIYYKSLEEWYSMVRADAAEPLRFLIEGKKSDETT